MSTSILESLLYDQMQWTFYYLSVKDLSSLACTSKYMSDLVCMHWNYYCVKYNMKSIVNLFFDNQLVLKEEELVRDIFVSGRYSWRWLYIHGVQFGKIRRKLVATIDYYNFIHKGNPEYIFERYDHTLKRNIVVLKNVCWLDLNHTFQDVSRGQYKMILRIKLNDVYWPGGANDEPTKIACTWECNGEPHTVVGKIGPDQWNQMERDPYKSLDNCWVSDVDEDDGWFSVCMGPLIITKTCNVWISFRDVVNMWWKSGILWDYLELRPFLA